MNAIVFDGFKARCLLSMLLSEDMISIYKDEDGVLESIRHQQVPNSVRNAILEQMILFPKIIMDKRIIHNGKLSFCGKLIETGELEFTEFPNNEIYNELPGGFLCTANILRTMLSEKNLIYSVKQIEEITKKAIDAYRLRSDFIDKGGQLPDNISMFFYQNGYNMKSFSSQGIDIFNRTEPLLSQFMPIFQELSTLSRVTSVAKAYDARVCVSTDDRSTTPSIDTLTSNPNNSLILLKFISKNYLHIISERKTLTETYEFSKLDSSIHFSEKLDEWIENIQLGNIDYLEQIQEEIKYAEKEIAQSQKKHTPIGKACTYIGLPLALFGFSPLSYIAQLSSATGFTVAYAGALSQLQTDRIESKCRFVKFGKEIGA